MRKLSLVLVVTLLSLTPGLSQKFLALEKLGKVKRITYNIGERLEYKLKEEPFERSDIILDLVDSVIVFDYGFITLKQIDYIKKKKSTGFFSPSNAPKVITAGVLLFITDWFNQSVVQGNDFQTDGGVTRVSLGLIGVGVIWLALRSKKFRPKGNKRIRIVMITDDR